MAQEFKCPVQATLHAIGGKWKVLILWNLRDGVLRFGQLRREVGDITQKMLTQQLRELERDGLISRRVYAEVPPRVEYALTGFGKTLEPILDAMFDWGLEFARQTGAEVLCGGEMDARKTAATP